MFRGLEYYERKLKTGDREIGFEGCGNIAILPPTTPESRLITPTEMLFLALEQRGNQEFRSRVAVEGVSDPITIMYDYRADPLYTFMEEADGKKHY